MSRLLEASERLKTAINSLEAVAESRLAQESGKQSAAFDEADALRGQLDALRQDYDKLASTTQTVSARLDGAVGQLRLVLEDDREQKQA